MADKMKLDVRDPIRVGFSGMFAFVIVHLFLLPQLVAFGVGASLCLFVGVTVTGILSVAMNVMLKPRDRHQAVAPAE
ncbi:hypothetical protein [Jannaschia sp. CCS1]|uniref:hypothetical protein n=1 Tax=Jannaschia sp. (strain CCS1) TaxID=290400 RepID=UPI000053DE2A|nr:hypothetical protein [Jannaschia sp. CCS1]ABD54140.1 hypothetical protein Jann_1223 [Jannaschia sp. CCS1]